MKNMLLAAIYQDVTATDISLVQCKVALLEKDFKEIQSEDQLVDKFIKGLCGEF